MRRALVTGGAGFIGSALVRLLSERGYEVCVFDDLSAGSPANLDGTDAELVVGDVRDPDALSRAAKGSEVVFHLAAGAGVFASIEDPFADFDLNAGGTLAALWAARQGGAERLVFSSSNAPLGTGAYPASEEKPTAPLSPYGASKATGEAYCSAFHGAYGFDAVVVRFSNAYGPRSAHKGNVIPTFIRRLLAGEELVVYGDGSQTRDFVFVTDLADGVETSLNDLLARLAEVSGRDPVVRREPARAGEIQRNYSLIDKARARLGYEPRVSLADGLRRTYEWFESLDTALAS